MTYAIQSDLETRIGLQKLIELTDEDQLGVVNAAAVAIVLKDTDAEINSFLAGRYTLPLAQSSDELVRLACAIAHYHLSPAEDTAKDGYSAAISKLRDISAGRASLGIDQASQPVKVAGGATISSGGRDFSRAKRAGV